MKIRRIDFFPDEWIAGCVSLDNACRGLYITACALIYSAGKPIRLEHLRAACLDHGKSFKCQLDRLLTLGKLQLNAGEIGSKRCQNELENVSKRLQKLSESGTLGNDIKKKNAATRALNGHATTTTTTIEEEDKSSSPHTPRLRGATMAGFDEWWKTYPHKVGKGSAKKAWAKAASAATLDELIAGVQRYIANKPADIHWCHPSRWLNDERWLDEPHTNGAASPEPLTEAQRAANLLTHAKRYAWRRVFLGVPDDVHTWDGDPKGEWFDAALVDRETARLRDHNQRSA